VVEIEPRRSRWPAQVREDSEHALPVAASMARAAWKRRVTILRTGGMPIVDTIGAWYWWQRLIVSAACGQVAEVRSQKTLNKGKRWAWAKCPTYHSEMAGLDAMQ